MDIQMHYARALMDREPEQMSTLSETISQTRNRLHGAALKEWGCVEGSGGEPKVFKLTGLTAEQVRGLSSEVDQHITPCHCAPYDDDML